MTKEKFTVQYLLRSVPEMLLWDYISTDSGLSSWFADNVRHNGDNYIFDWDGFEEPAVLAGAREPEYIRFTRPEDDTYWELRISVDELTDETVLTVTDFADPGETEDEIELWNAQIDRLREAIGCR